MRASAVMRAAAPAVVAAVFSGGAHGGVIMSKPGGAAGRDTGYITNLTPPAFSGIQIADDFTLPLDGTITSVRWWGGSTQNSPTQFLAGFQVQVWEGQGSTPETIVLDHTFTIGQLAIASDPHPGRPMWRYEAALPASLDLTGGTRYWFSVTARKSTTSTVDIWLWQHAALGEAVFLARRGLPSGSWSEFGPSVGAVPALAFELEGTLVPGVGGSAVLLVGSPLLAMRRRRRSRV